MSTSTSSRRGFMAHMCIRHVVPLDTKCVCVTSVKPVHGVVHSQSQAVLLRDQKTIGPMWRKSKRAALLKHVCPGWGCIIQAATMS